jgi:hypothetical protein
MSMPNGSFRQGSAATDHNRDIPWSELKLMLEDAEQSKQKDKRQHVMRQLQKSVEHAVAHRAHRLGQQEPHGRTMNPWMLEVILQKK